MNRQSPGDLAGTDSPAASMRLVLKFHLLGFTAVRYAWVTPPRLSGLILGRPACHKGIWIAQVICGPAPLAIASPVCRPVKRVRFFQLLLSCGSHHLLLSTLSSPKSDQSTSQSPVI